MIEPETARQDSLGGTLNDSPGDLAGPRVPAMLDLARAGTGHRIVVAIIAGVLAFIFLSQGITAPFAKDQEPQSAQWIADMAGHGHWLLCRDYYGYLCRKPPLFYWLSSILIDLTGGHVDEARTRVVSLLAGTAVAVEVLYWSSLQIGAVTGWLAFLFLLGSYGFASRATVNLTDMLLTATLFGGYCLVYPLAEPSTVSPMSGHASYYRRTLGAGVLVGLAVLDKGPVSIVLIGLALFFFMLIAGRDPFALLRRGWPWECLAVALIAGATWYVPAYVAGGNNFLKVMLEENFGHLAPAAMGGTGEAARPIYYIVVRLLGGMLPLSLLLIAAFVAIRCGSYADRAWRPIAYQIGMAVAVIFLFSLASAKRDDYILPAIPGLAILLAGLFGSLSGGSEPSRNATTIMRNFTAAIIAACTLAGVVTLLIVVHLHGEFLTARISLQSSDAAMVRLLADTVSRPSVGLALVIAMAAVGGITLIAVIWRAPAWAIGLGLGLIGLAGVSLFTGSIRPGFARERSSGAFAIQVRQMIGNSQLYVIGEPDYAFSFYYGRAVPVFEQGQAPKGWQPIFFVTRAPLLKLLPRQMRSRIRLVLRSNSVDRSGPLGLYQLVISDSGARNSG